MSLIFAFDTETRGLDASTDEVLSLAYVILDSELNERARGVKYAHPSDPALVSTEAAAINGYTQEEWDARGATTQEGLFIWLGGVFLEHDLNRAVPMGYNVAFDLGFLAARARRDAAFDVLFRRALGYHALDAMGFAIALDFAHKTPLLPGQTAHKYSLVYQMERVGMPLVNAHDALADVLATVALFRAQCGWVQAGQAPPPPPAVPFVKQGSDGVWAFQVGKHRGRSTRDVPRDYVRWALTKVVLQPEERAHLNTCLDDA